MRILKFIKTAIIALYVTLFLSSNIAQKITFLDLNTNKIVVWLYHHINIWLTKIPIINAIYNNFSTTYLLSDYLVVFSTIFFILLYIAKIVLHSTYLNIFFKLNKYNEKKLQNLNWEKYEELIKKIFEKNGYKVSRIGGHGADGGIDLIVRKHNEYSMVQCKRYKNNVGVKVIREMFAVGIHHKFDKVYIYTSAGFTKEAVSFAHGKNIQLYDGKSTIKQINKL